MPTVSIIMSVYNAMEHLKEAIDSILEQSFTDFEFIIINDASTDDGPNIIRSYNDPRIVLFDNEKNIGLTRSLNVALSMATGEYIARMDADDVSVRERLQKQVNFLDKNPSYGICGTWMKIVDDLFPAFQYPVSHEEIKFNLLWYNCIGHPSVMFRRSLLRNYDLKYNEEFKTSQDYELWSRIIQVTKAFNIPEYLMKYRIHENQVSAKRNSNQNDNADKIKLKQLSILELFPNNQQSIAHLCLFGDGFKKFSDANSIKQADIWMNTIFLKNKELRVYDETLLLNYWRKKFYGHYLYKYDLSIWAVLNHSYCKKYCKLPLKLQCKQFIKCLLNWKVKK